MPDVISVALIEDNRLVRDAFTALLNELPDVKVTAAVPSPDPELLRSARPDVVLLDVGLSDHDSLRVAADLKKELPAAKVIVMDLLPVHEDIAEFVNAGVAGFILKDATFGDVVTAIRSVAVGGIVLPVRMTGSLFAQIARDVHPERRQQALDDVRITAREREVIDLISEGLSNKQIAGRLNIATHTVKSHVRNVMEKLALHSRLQIAAYTHRERAP